MTDSSEKGIIVEESAKEVITVKKAIAILFAISVLLMMAACSQSKKEQPQSSTEKENTTAEITAQPTTEQPAANGETSASEFDFDSKTVKLNSGYEMPILGLGTWTLSNEEAENSVYHALKDGFRLIDTARYYQCETGVGKGIKKAVEEGIVKREDVFVTSKIMPSDYERAAQGINDSLRDLGLEYIDLMLIHQPGSNDEAVYKAMEQAVRDGKVRSIGISNYYTPEAFDEVMSYAQIPPAVIQNENHIYYQNTALQEYVRKYGVVVESWYPFGGRGHTSENFNNETVTAIAKSHGKTSAQVILRWHLQAGYIAIPSSSNPDHIAENYRIFDFELTDDEMRQIAAVNKNQRYENW